MKITYCEKCHNKKRVMSLKAAISEIESITGSKVDVNCFSYCGFGSQNHMIEIDREIISSDTFEGLLEEIRSII